jgi:hypothetical protein
MVGSNHLVASGTHPIDTCGCQEDLVQGAIDANNACFCNEDDDCECWNDDNDCGCDGKPKHGGSGSTVVRTTATGAVIIPAVQVVTTVDCYTTGTNNTVGHVTQTVDKTRDYDVCGDLKTDTYECQSGTFSGSDCWKAKGCKSCEYADEHDTDEACKCECRNMRCPDNEKYFEGCSCGGKCDEHKGCDPEEDIDEKINAQIDKAISEILSDVVERCISSSLKGCIEI